MHRTSAHSTLLVHTHAWLSKLFLPSRPQARAYLELARAAAAAHPASDPAPAPGDARQPHTAAGGFEVGAFSAEPLVLPPHLPAHAGGYGYARPQPPRPASQAVHQSLTAALRDAATLMAASKQHHAASPAPPPLAPGVLPHADHAWQQQHGKDKSSAVPVLPIPDGTATAHVIATRGSPPTHAKTDPLLVAPAHLHPHQGSALESPGDDGGARASSGATTADNVLAALSDAAHGAGDNGGAAQGWSAAAAWAESARAAEVSATAAVIAAAHALATPPPPALRRGGAGASQDVTGAPGAGALTFCRPFGSPGYTEVLHQPHALALAQQRMVQQHHHHQQGRSVTPPSPAGRAGRPSADAPAFQRAGAGPALLPLPGMRPPNDALTASLNPVVVVPSALRGAGGALHGTSAGASAAPPLDSLLGEQHSTTSVYSSSQQQQHAGPTLPSPSEALRGPEPPPHAPHRDARPGPAPTAALAPGQAQHQGAAAAVVAALAGCGSPPSAPRMVPASQVRCWAIRRPA